jgi:hypothetical protein
MKKFYLLSQYTGVLLSQFQISKSLKPIGTGEPFSGLVLNNPRGESFLGRATQRSESDS